MLYTEGCPHAAAYLPHLQQLVAPVGAPVRTRFIADHDPAQRERFLGSPTIRVTGLDTDPTAEGRDDDGLSCRLYPTFDGPPGNSA